MKRTSTTITLLLIAAATATILAAERSTIQYKGMSVRDPAPYGEAGLAWQNNFKALTGDQAANASGEYTVKAATTKLSLTDPA